MATAQDLPVPVHEPSAYQARLNQLLALPYVARLSDIVQPILESSGIAQRGSCMHSISSLHEMNVLCFSFRARHSRQS